MPRATKPRVRRVIDSSVLPCAMKWPSASEGAPPYLAEPWPRAGVGWKGVMALNSHSVVPEMRSGMWVELRCAWREVEVSRLPRVPSPLSPSETVVEDAARTAV